MAGPNAGLFCLIVSCLLTKEEVQVSCDLGDGLGIVVLSQWERTLVLITTEGKREKAECHLLHPFLQQLPETPVWEEEGKLGKEQ